MKKALTLTLLLAAFSARLEAQVILQDNFTYADGLTTNVSSGAWALHSGANDSSVRNNRLEVFGTRTGDINRAYTGVPGTVTYASFIVNMTNLPTAAAGAYFAHFKDNGTANFRSRTWAMVPVGTASRSWRLGVSNAGNTPNVVPLDLATNVDYRVVIMWDNVTLTARAWIDPEVEGDPSAFGNDGTTALTLTTFAFRQNTGMGSQQIDDLFVGNSFADVNVGGTKPPTVYYQPRELGPGVCRGQHQPDGCWRRSRSGHISVAALRDQSHR